MDKAKFYIKVKQSFGIKSLSSLQVQGFEAIFIEWDLWVCRKWTDNDIRKLAYIFATDWHEGNKTMQPIKEFGTDAYFTKLYWTNQRKAKELGNLSARDAINFCGKGKPQLTGRANYTKMSKLLGIDLVKNPNLMLTMKVATEVMFEGMMSGRSLKGDFTGKQLSNFFNNTTEDPLGARKIINGTDKAELIKGYYLVFLAALRYSLT